MVKDAPTPPPRGSVEWIKVGGLASRLKSHSRLQLRDSAGLSPASPLSSGIRADERLYHRSKLVRYA